MRSLITGGAGFIGSAVVRTLLQEGQERPLVFDLSPQAPRLAGVLDRIELVQGDLGNFSHVLDAVKRAQPAGIYHLGAMLSRPSEADPPAALRANALGTFHVLEAARLFEVPQVLYASTIGTYGLGLPDGPIDDHTLQRPELFYGATKVFGEHMGLFYRRKYGLDFRAVRYPSIVGPGITTQGVDHYTSWVIEECALGRPFTIWVTPETCMPMLYVKDAAGAIIKLGRAPRERIQTVNYGLGGVQPVVSAGELAEMVRAKIPAARISFEVDQETQQLLDNMLRPIDDRNARREWGWQPEYDLERLVDDFIAALRPKEAG